MTEPQIVLRTEQPYLGIRERLTDGIRDFADSAFPELFGWLARHGANPAGPPFLRYHEVDPEGEPLEVEAGFPVTSAPDGEGRIQASALPAGRYMTYIHVGP